MPTDLAANVLACRECHVGTMVKRETGWTCDRCGYAPFADAPREKVPPPAPVGVKEPLPEKVRARDLASPVSLGPVPVLFPANEPRPRSGQLFWADGGVGIRYAAEIPLQVVPPEEPVELRLLAQNSGPYVVGVLMSAVVETDGRSEPRTLQTLSGDLPVGTVLDATYPLPPAPDSTRCQTTVYGRAVVASGRFQDLWKAPALLPRPGPPEKGPTFAQASAQLRGHARCPRCEGRMRWVPSEGPKPRGWVCVECAHRVETGILP
ncbi:MAG: hypothetical protein KGJ23_09550 [Euryarchaeota archaeon]|nr:hypothetical protein [Euryarchaeota archaeon]MDE1836847.1 hypothetical protein [Euryarchaeota archaeon]MDE1879726.1 hypothetical protein [Euryarchaeota archaeon]MDE2046051.1 hypothetical protein [Thermoplasmata archaeon]